MRDLERWKDKVELSLDGRQIFFLFFGSAVAACLIFVAGVLTGKRIAERAALAAAPAAEDPLAALDRLGPDGQGGEADDDGLTFHQALAPAAGERHGRAPRREQHEPTPPPPPAPAPEAAAPAAAAGGHYTLQLSAFVEKEDAREFMQKMQAAGFKPFLVQSDIPGRGVFYRVRVGDYPTKKAANEAKSDLQRKQHVLAYIARL